MLWEVLDMLETACKVELEKADSVTWPAVVSAQHVVLCSQRSMPSALSLRFFDAAHASSPHTASEAQLRPLGLSTQFMDLCRHLGSIAVCTRARYMPHCHSCAPAARSSARSVAVADIVGTAQRLTFVFWFDAA